MTESDWLYSGNFQGMVAHLRDESIRHHLGCWVVDLLHGKSRFGE